MKIIKIIWQILRKIKFLMIVSILALSLVINGTLFMGGKLLSVFTGSFEAITGFQTLDTKNKAKLSNLDDKLLVERKIKRELKTELAETSSQLVIEKKAKRQLKNELAETTLQVTTERRLKRELKTELTETAGKLAVEKQSKRVLKKQIKNQANELALSAAVNQTADRIGKRSLMSAKRNIATMPGASIPWIGPAVIVSITTLELYDLCETIKDMNKLRKIFNPLTITSDEELTVCSLEAPSKKDIIKAVKKSPSAAWEKAKEITPTLEEIKKPDMPDFSGWFEEKQKNTTDLSEKIYKWWNEE